MSKIISRVKEVLQIENESLRNLIESIDDSIERLIIKISKLEGKLVLTGVGKPGHIAKKLAATFSSLGIPSFYLHPSEALHGDLGMVNSNDMVFAYSFSGSSTEVIDAVISLKHKNIYVVSFTSNIKSELAKISDETILYPKIKEACHLNLAPTSSTLVTLALGDALAVAASEYIGFTSQNFAVNHPAGRIGKRLIMKVDDVMDKNDSIPIVKTNDNLDTILKEFGKKALGFVSLVDNNNELKGVISDGDIRRALRKFDEKVTKITAKSIATMNPTTVKSENLLIDTFNFFKKNNLSFAPVIDNNNKLIGAITMKQIINSGIV